MPLPDAMITITISMNAARQVAVEGPLDQTLLCYGLLELARDQIHRTSVEGQMKISMPTTGELSALSAASANKKP